MTGPRLGLRENLPQFGLLVFLNAFVGAMVGLERTALPLLGEEVFDRRSDHVSTGHAFDTVTTITTWPRAPAWTNA